MKYVLVLAVVVAVLWMLSTKTRRPGGRTESPRPPPPQVPQAMTRCAHCGLHLPAADAVVDGAQQYCSDAHRRLGPTAG
ncbi:PP0621 family protein [Ideonella sp. A 288]|uniref:PP0621 family protein n=1 Tax=Ideonella sp. A 288 TaxID=1962181 RepID=UPI000B4AB45B|nr:PP0621 family protein [Ideonella sp. A 288]